MKHNNTWRDIVFGILLFGIMFVFAACAEPHFNKETNKLGGQYHVQW